MGVWLEDFSKIAKELDQKKYAFSCFNTEKLIADPANFDARYQIREFKALKKQYNFLNDNFLYFPIVQKQHWIVCFLNLTHNQFHIFDSMMKHDNTSMLKDAANNLVNARLINNRENKEDNLDKIIGKYLTFT
ncbi:unnamed protein product [Alopecurus aequalis]